MRIREATIIGLCIGLVACGGSKPTPENPDRTANDATAPTAKPGGGFTVEMAAANGDLSVMGVTRDRATRQPLAGVTLTIESPAMQGTQATISDVDGGFAYASLPPGRYTMTAYYLDQTMQGSFAVEAGKVVRITLDWAADGGGEVVQIEPRLPEFKTAIEALKHGALPQAVTLGQAELATRPSSQLHALLALAKYGSAIEELMMAGRASDDTKPAEMMRRAMANLASSLDAVQGHLAAAAQDPAFALELCVACMAGEDGYLFLLGPGGLDVERDRSGQPLPEGDPRRRPTYRFDHGDLAWGRAIIHFQQALTNVTLAYDWSWIDTMAGLDDGDGATLPTITIKLVEPDRVAHAREHLLAGLAASSEARTAFLAETDDDREWVPNPKQQSYASPLPVDAKLYQTWADIVGDVRALVEGKAGLSLAGLWQVFGERNAPPGFVDVGAMLSSPRDITFALGAIDQIENETNAGKRNKMLTTLLEGVLGNGYKKKMKASKITDRLIQLRKDYEGAETAFEDKLKYVLWLN